MQCGLTLGGLVLGAVAVVAAQAGVERAAEALVVEHGERVEADARLVVELSTVRHVAAAHRPVRLLTVETRVDPWEEKTGGYTTVLLHQLTTHDDTEFNI